MKRFSPTDDQLRAFAFANDQERLDAKVIAELYQLGHVKAASDVLEVVGRSPQMLRLVADELEGKCTKSELTSTGLNILRAYIAACEAKGFNFEPPTLFEAKIAYARAFVQEQRPKDQTARRWLAELARRRKIPRDCTFRKTLTRCEFEFCKEKRTAV